MHATDHLNSVSRFDIVMIKGHEFTRWFIWCLLVNMCHTVLPFKTIISANNQAINHLVINLEVIIIIIIIIKIIIKATIYLSLNPY